jgi:RNA polymerase sigma-70 factor (ECF subfamily)
VDVNDAPTPAVLVHETIPMSSRAEAFRRLTDAHLDSSYRLARVILGDRVDAEDAVHDACLLAWQKWSTLRDQHLFERWFQRILVNTCRDRLRRGARWQVVDVSAELSVPGVDEFAATDRRTDVGMALARLAPDDRVILALRYYRDLTVEDIGQLLGIPPGTVKSRLHHALKRLHGALGDAEPSEVTR